MLIRFYGTRGSLPTPGASTVRYGGNTSCVMVRSQSGTLVIIDAVTGAAVLGRELVAAGIARVSSPQACGCGARRTVRSAWW
jgi:hypothetical protein